jgi:hypothetical protein
MRRYSTDGNQNAAAATTILALESATTIRPSIYYFCIGSAAAPADQAANVQLNRITAVGTRTTVTPQAFDPGDPASLAAGAENHTAEPTKTAGAVMLSASVNQQQTFVWQTIPEEGIYSPATANNGIAAVFAVATGTALYEATFHHQE